MWLGVSLSILGLQCVFMGILTQVFFDYSGEATRRWFSRFPYTRTVGIAAGMFAGGVTLTGLLAASYVRHNYRLPDVSAANHLGVTGLLLMILGFMTFTFTLLLHSTAVAVRRR